MKKLILFIALLTSIAISQNDILLKSSGTSPDRGVVIQNSLADTLVDIDGDGAMTLFGGNGKGARLRLYNSDKTEFIEFTSFNGDNGQVLTTNGNGILTWKTLTLTDTDDQTIRISGDTLYISEGNFVDLSAYKNTLTDTDDQTIRISGDTLYISEGNFRSVCLQEYPDRHR